MSSISAPVSLSPTTFVAPWPEEMKPTQYSMIAHKIWNILCVMPLFPIGIVRYSYSSLQDLAGRVIHPASRSSKPRAIEWERNSLIEQGGEEITIGTPDGTKINAMLFRGRGRNRGTVIRALGNNDFYENSGSCFLDVIHTFVGRDVDVLMFNPRGCGKSTGASSPLGLALDAYSAGEYLVQRDNVDPSRILYYGHSLGGSYGVAGAALLQKQHPQARVSALSDRSFSSLSAAAYEIFGTSAVLLIRFLDWELVAKKAWGEVKGRKIILYDRQDNCIPYAASFHKYIENVEMQKQVCDPLYVPDVNPIEMHSDLDQDANPHCRFFTDEEGSAIGQQIRAALES